MHEVTDRIGLNAGGQDPTLAANESQDLTGEKLLSSQTDDVLNASDYFISFPDDVARQVEGIRTEDLVVSATDSATFDFKGKEIVNLETEDTASDPVVGMEYLKTFTEDISHERMFPDALTLADGDVCEEGIWNIGLEAGESSSSGHAVWESLGQYHAQEMEAEPAAGSCSLWDLTLHNLEEDLDIDKYVGAESFLQEPKDDGGQQNDDCPRELGP